MTSAQLFGRVVARLDAADIPHMLTGSFAAAYHGHPRATQDIDFVIAPTAAQIRALIGALPREEFYADSAAALEALAHEGLFNLVDLTTGWKVDLICRKERPFSRQEFERRTHAVVDGIALDIATVEDVILSKLEWARLGESTRQVEDVAALLAIRGDDLDHAYLDRWVPALGITREWAAARRAADRQEKGERRKT